MRSGAAGFVAMARRSDLFAASSAAAMRGRRRAEYHVLNALVQIDPETIRLDERSARACCVRWFMVSRRWGRFRVDLSICPV
jgi:hypothetical protein